MIDARGGMLPIHPLTRQGLAAKRRAQQYFRLGRMHDAEVCISLCVASASRYCPQGVVALKEEPLGNFTRIIRKLDMSGSALKTGGVQGGASS